MAPPELIGASLLLGLVAVLTISTHGGYLIALALGNTGADLPLLAELVIAVAGFAGSLWLLALRRWAWGLSLAFAAVEAGIHGFILLQRLGANRGPDILGALGELVQVLVFLVVLAFLAGRETRALLEARESYRRRGS